MKRAVRTSVLVVAVACTCLASVRPVKTPTKDAPEPLCGRKICTGLQDAPEPLCGRKICTGIR